MTTRPRTIWLFAAMLLASCGTVPKTTITSFPEGPPIASVDDSLFARVLERAVAPDGAVSYSELQSDTDLTAYLRQIAAVQTDAFISRSELLAFWINVHNAYVLDMIRKAWPIHSIDDISGFRYANVVLAGGNRYSLDAIEHAIIEKQFREPRAFFALFDGSRSSPLLQRVPYTEANLSEELDHQLKSFLADSTKNYLDRRANTLYLSKIFETYSSDLADAAGGTLADFVRDFAPPSMAQWIGRHHDVNILYLRYDNTINTSDIEPTHVPTHYPTRRRESGGIR
ncbi:MAG TPA: DUF547 domain-containing protein [Candidatus Kapabacteria bacterium]|nr:DUF547 domain-containing protein [Candidatus Kapabacteria bacterium]HET6402525.1 DUF547 domain-containing protein [Candidatus Kapabacteria bacterium]